MTDEVNLSSQDLDELPLILKTLAPSSIVASFNRIARFDPGDWLRNLLRLDLSHNCLQGSLPVLGAAAPCLEVLNISHNKLTSLVGVSGCLQLRDVWVNDNALAAPLATAVLPLTQLPQLSVLALHNNPCLDGAASIDEVGPTPATDPRVLFVINACSSSLRRLSVSAPRVIASEEGLAGGCSLADGGEGPCARVAHVTTIDVSPELAQAARAWHAGFAVSTPPLRHLVSSHVMVRSGSTRSLLGLPPPRPALMPFQAHSLVRVRSSKTVGSHDFACSEHASVLSVTDAGSHVFSLSDDDVDTAFLVNPGCDTHARFTNPISPAMKSRSRHGVRTPATSTRAHGAAAVLPAIDEVSGAGSISPEYSPKRDASQQPEQFASSPLARPATSGGSGDRSSGKRAAALALPALAQSGKLGSPGLLPRSPPTRASPLIRPHSSPQLKTHVKAAGSSVFRGAPPVASGDASFVRQKVVQHRQHAGVHGALSSPKVARTATEAGGSQPLLSSGGTADGAGFRVTFSGEVLAAAGGGPGAGPDGGIALRVLADGAAAAVWPDGRPALAVMVDDRATAALRRLAASAGAVGIDEAESAAIQEQAASPLQSAYGVIAYAFETAPTAAAAQADAVAGACVAVDGFGVGFVSSVHNGATVVHLADDGSGFHADDLGNVQRRWDTFGAVTFAAPDYRDTDLSDVTRLGELALSAAAAAAASSRPGRMSARGIFDPVAQARAALENAYAAAETARSPELPDSHESDASSLRRALLQEVFPDAGAAPGGIPPAASHAPVSYFSSPTGVAFMLGSCLGVFLDLRGDRVLKLFLACRRFRYELLVAPGVPVALSPAPQLAESPSEFES